MAQNPADDRHRREQRLRAAQHAAHAKRRTTLDTHQTAADTIRARELTELAQLQQRVESVQETTTHVLERQSNTTAHTIAADPPLPTSPRTIQP